MTASEESASEYAKRMLTSISGKPVSDVELLLQSRPIKINTVFSLDGLRMVLSGKSSGGRQLIFSLLTPLLLSEKEEAYIKRLDSFLTKLSVNPNIKLDLEHDGISKEVNQVLYNHLTEKMGVWPFVKLPANQRTVLDNGKQKFAHLTLEDQVKTLLSILGLFNSASTGSDLFLLGGSMNAGVKLQSYCLSNWKKNYKDVRIIDQSASGLFESRSGNLLELL